MSETENSGTGDLGKVSEASSNKMESDVVTGTSVSTETESLRLNTADKDTKLDIVNFNAEAGMQWTAYLNYFNSICVEKGFDALWKIRNIQKFLTGSALTLYINNCLNVLHWEELVALFNEEFVSPGELTLRDFADLKFQKGENVNEYYQKKIKVGRSLGLDTKLLMDGLTEGLSHSLQQLVIVNAPKTLSEWREIVYKLNKNTEDQKEIDNDSKLRQTKPIVNPPFFKSWQPTRPSQEFYSNQPFRPWNYRVPYQAPQTRPYGPYNASTIRNRPPNANNRNIHFGQMLPPRPCRICLNSMGLTNVYHWERECPFRTRVVPPSQNREVGSAADQISNRANFSENNRNTNQSGNNESSSASGNKY